MTGVVASGVLKLGCGGLFCRKKGDGWLAWLAQAERATPAQQARSIGNESRHAAARLKLFQLARRFMARRDLLPGTGIR
jgi:hypothetical protein